MRPTIPLLVVALSLATLGGWSGVRAHAAEESKDITRVAIAISGRPVAYTDQLRENPPAIVIEFRSRNVIAALEPTVVVNSGIIEEIQSDYYPPGRRALKRLTLTLVQPAAYTIAQQANQIVVDIETPASVLPGRMAVGQGVTVLGIEANETLIQRLKVMEGALWQAGPQTTPVASTPKPVVVTTPVEIPQPVVQPAPAPTPVSRKRHGGFWYGLLLGIGGTVIAVTGWRRRRKPVLIQEGTRAAAPEVSVILQTASVLEELVLKAMQRQGYRVIASKAVADLGTLWIVRKDDARSGLVCLADGGFFERKVLEQFVDALQQEALRSGTVYALGAFTAPAQAFATENQIHLISREEVVQLMDVELKGPVLTPDAQNLSQQLVKSQSDLDQAQAKIQALEQQSAELTRELAEKVALYATLSQEADQLKAKSAEVDQRLAAEQEKRTQLETQIVQLEAQLKGQASTVAEKAQCIQESTEAANDTIKAVAAEEPKVTQEVLLAPLETSQASEQGDDTQSLTGQSQEHRKWPRFDLSRHKGKGVLIRVTSNDGEPMNGDAHNISAGGLCVELPSGEALADEFEVKLFLPDRTKPIEAIGKLMWKGRGSRRRLGQLGIAFNAPDQEAISQFVEEQSLKPVSVG